MGTSSHFYMEREGVAELQRKLVKAADYLAAGHLTLNNESLSTLLAEYDRSGDLDRGWNEFFQPGLKRLRELAEVLGAYLEEIDRVQEESGKRITDVETSMVNLFSIGFGEMYNTELADTGDYINNGWVNSGKAYRFSQSGKSFLTDYNDVMSFQQSDAYKYASAVTSVSKWSKYKQFFAQSMFGHTEVYTEQLMEDALKSTLSSLPGYNEVDKTGISWSAAEKQLGVKGLSDAAKLFFSAMELYGKTGIKDEEVTKAIAEMQEYMKDVPGGREFLDEYIEQVSNLQFSKESAGKLGDKFSGAMDGMEYVMWGSEMLLHITSNHSMQVSYLETMEESLLAAGYDYAPVIETVGQLKQQYADDMTYFVNEVWGKVKEEGLGKAYGMVDKLPGVNQISGGVNLGLGVISFGAKIAEGDRISAAESLMGLQQFSGALSRTYEKYNDLIEQGIATEADARRADDLFELLRVTKMKEYENIMTISYNKDLQWYNLAKEKYAELAAMGK